MPPVVFESAADPGCYLSFTPTQVVWKRFGKTGTKEFRETCLFQRVDGGGYRIEITTENGMDTKERFLRSEFLRLKLDFRGGLLRRSELPGRDAKSSQRSWSDEGLWARRLL